MSDNITLPRAVGKLVQDLIDHAYNDGVEELEHPSEQTTEALNALFAALAEPPATREPATMQQIVATHRTTYGAPWLDEFDRAWKAAERFHGIGED